MNDAKSVRKNTIFGISFTGKHGRGFTLIEMIVVVIIIGVLSTFGIAHYRSSRESVFCRLAQSQLKIIQAAEYNVQSERGAYQPCANSGQCQTNLRIVLAGRNAWNYSVTTGIGTFSARATRIGGSGTFNGCFYLIDQDDEDPVNNGCLVP